MNAREARFEEIKKYLELQDLINFLDKENKMRITQLKRPGAVLRQKTNDKKFGETLRYISGFDLNEMLEKEGIEELEKKQENHNLSRSQQLLIQAKKRLYLFEYLLFLEWLYDDDKAEFYSEYAILEANNFELDGEDWWSEWGRNLIVQIVNSNK
jgi:hypothetical protein